MRPPVRDGWPLLFQRRVRSTLKVRAPVRGRPAGSLVVAIAFSRSCPRPPRARRALRPSRRRTVACLPGAIAKPAPPRRSLRLRAPALTAIARAVSSFSDPSQGAGLPAGHDTGRRATPRETRRRPPRATARAGGAALPAGSVGVPGAGGASGAGPPGSTGWAGADGGAGARPTFTRNAAVESFPTRSRARQVTVVSPSANSLPGPGVQPSDPAATPDGSTAIGRG